MDASTSNPIAFRRAQRPRNPQESSASTWWCAQAHSKLNQTALWDSHTLSKPATHHISMSYMLSLMAILLWLVVHCLSCSVKFYIYLPQHDQASHSPSQLGYSWPLIRVSRVWKWQTGPCIMGDGAVSAWGWSLCVCVFVGITEADLQKYCMSTHWNSHSGVSAKKYQFTLQPGKLLTLFSLP